MMIRSHECVMDGFERNENGNLVTIFSCPDYAGKFANQGAMIKIKKNFELTPHILTPTNNKVGIWITPESCIKSNI